MRVYRRLVFKYKLVTTICVTSCSSLSSDKSHKQVELKPLMYNLHESKYKLPGKKEIIIFTYVMRNDNKANYFNSVKFGNYSFENANIN